MFVFFLLLLSCFSFFFFFFSSRRRHTRLQGDWSSDVCSSDLRAPGAPARVLGRAPDDGRRGARAPRGGHEPAAAARGRRQGGRDAHPPGLPRASPVTRLLAAGAVLAAAAAVVAFAFVLRAPGPPRPTPVTVTLEEGARFAASGFGAEESFLCLLEDPRFLASEDLPPAGAEGYLFPDTYQFPLATPQERILRAMVHRFREVSGPSLGRRAAAHGLTEEQAVTLASLVEEETARPEERRLVAAVFLNRLHRGMPLQSDPTVLYGRPDGSRTITRADLARPTPYNTYTIGGLPPTPIANPGKDALEAAVDPAPVDYLYFVARGDGSHEFSTTLAAHNAAVARYQPTRDPVSGRKGSERVRR